LLTAYDRIRIINLPERTDRRREMLGELKRIGLEGDPRVEFVEAVAPESSGAWDSRGAHGCYMSHLAILRAARDSDQSVLILEDDCDFTDAAFASDWGAGSDIFYGGFGASNFSDLHSSNIQGSHCMGFSRSVLPRLVQYIEQLTQVRSPPPIDGAYVRFRNENPDVLTSFALPQVAVQRQSASDIAPGCFDRNRWLALVIGLARRMNRNRYRRAKMMEGVSPTSSQGRSDLP
jgi:glycosyl transferase family 25